MTARRIFAHPLVWTAVVFLILPRVAGANPFTGTSGFVDIATTMLIFGLFASGFNLLLGHVGELSFGHAMFFAIGAYTTALDVKGFNVSVFGLTWNHDPNPNMWIALLLSVLFVFIWSVVLARLIVPRSSGVYYSMITLAFAQVIYFIAFTWSDLTRGEDGIQGIPRPVLPGLPPGYLGDSYHFYAFTAIVVFVCMALMYWLTVSPFGTVLHAIRENKIRARFLGYDVNKYRVNAFVLSAIFPAIAGWLWVYYQQSINPDSSSVGYSGNLVMMSLLGGVQTFFGPILGSIVYWELQNNISQITKYWEAWIGVVFVIFVLASPQGIMGILEDIRHYGVSGIFSRRKREAIELDAELPRVDEVGAGNRAVSYVFKTEGLTKRFSGFTAVNDVSIEIPEGGVRTIIGPNGAGKTTFFNLLSGALPPTEGRIFFHDHNVTALQPYQRARLGIARSFQITNIFGRLTVAENVRLAVQAVSDGKANFFLPLKNARAVGATTDRILNDIGLWTTRTARAENLSHGDQRRLEIGLVLASDPPVLLLDEPLAGMSPTETHETVELIQRIAPGRTIMLVEHDIDVVMQISTSITVFQTGAVLATGTPEEIRANEAVQRAYLGELA